MKHRADGSRENAGGPRRRNPSLLKVGVSKLNNAKDDFVCRTIEGHTARVICVTYSCYPSLLTSRYLASSSFEFAASAQSARTQPDHARILAALASLEDPKVKGVGWLRKTAAKTGPVAVQGQVRSGCIWPEWQAPNPTTAGAGESQDSAVLNNSNT